MPRLKPIIKSEPIEVQEENKTDLKIEELKKLVTEYFDKDQAVKKLNVVCKELNPKIKDLMKESGLKEFITDNIIAIRDERISKGFNEEALLTKLLNIENLPAGIIKTRQYIDWEELEKELYKQGVPGENPVITAQELEPYSTESVTVVLTVKPIKKAKK